MPGPEIDWGVFWSACGAIVQLLAFIVVLLQWNPFTSYLKKNAVPIASKILFFLGAAWLFLFDCYFVYHFVKDLWNGIPLNEVLSFQYRPLLIGSIGFLGLFVANMGIALEDKYSKRE